MVQPLSLGQGRQRVLFIPHGDDVHDRRLLDPIKFPHKINAFRSKNDRRFNKMQALQLSYIVMAIKCLGENPV